MARVSGFCGDEGRFGVSGAIRLAQQAALDRPGETYVVGDLVHNTHVTTWLEQRYGLKFVKDLHDVPTGRVVVVKAHGAPPSFFAAALSSLNFLYL